MKGAGASKSIPSWSIYTHGFEGVGQSIVWSSMMKALDHIYMRGLASSSERELLRCGMMIGWGRASSVADCWENGAWNLDKLHTLLELRTKHQILQIPIPHNPEGNDTIIWRGDLSGCYSAASRYKWLQIGNNDMGRGAQNLEAMNA